MKGMKVLIVEDVDLMASTLQDMLTEAGADVVDVASSVASALQAMDRHTIDIACLDINLGSETSFPVADALALRGIAFVFVTACDKGALPLAHRQRPLVAKTEAHLELVRACLAAAPPFLLPRQLAEGSAPDSR
jgi:CheY-like chemotaxis protein